MTALGYIWGPTFEEYHTHVFEPHPSKLVDAEIAEFFEEHDSLLPLNCVETSLAYFDPRIDNVGFISQFGLSDIAAMLRKYLTQSKDKVRIQCINSIFKHYYGFLCARYLLHIACLSVLRQTSIQDEILDSLPRNASWAQFSQSIVFAALDKASEALANDESLEDLVSVVTGFFATGLDIEDVLFIITELWRDRDSLLTLCMDGMLPGCSLLLLSSMEVLPTEVNESTYKTYMYLQGLSFRLFLVGSHRDRQLLQPVCMFTPENDIDWPDDFEGYVDSADSQIITDAYFGLVAVWQETFNTEILPIDLAIRLDRFILKTAARNTEMRSHNLILTLHTSFRLLWLIFEHRGRIPVDDHINIRDYAITVFVFLEILQLRRICTDEDQYMLARMLADIELIALAGRILLLVMYEGCNFEDTYLLNSFLDQLKKLGDAISYSAGVAPELFNESKTEWCKVANHMTSYDKEVAGPINAPGSSEAECLWRMFEAWAVWSPLLNISQCSSPARCAYPRCFETIHKLPDMVKAQYACGRCNKVAYCNLVCQRA
ncbi:hypothetical protein FRC12_000463 [Ceratobasidium sp. 428]|nr:hypothetical protein FRC12_000463 [Ceratobasidium sp. 428]